MLNRRDFLKLVGIGASTLFGYYVIEDALSYQIPTDKPYYKIYIENGIAKALNVVKNTIDYSDSNHINVIQNALNNLPNRVQQLKISLLGDFVASDTIEIPSYTIFELQGSIKLADNVDKVLVQETNIIGGNTQIEMRGGLYDGNKTKQTSTAADDHVIKFNKVADSHFSNMVIQNAVNDNFTLDAGCNNNVCENISGRFAGTGKSSTNDGNGLVDRGNSNIWTNCISEDNFSDCWVIKCKNSVFKNCIGRGSKNAVGFGLFADRNITGNIFNACQAYNNHSSGMTLNIPSKSDGDGILVENNFIQGEFFNNGSHGVRFQGGTSDGNCRNNVMDVLTHGNKEEGFLIDQQSTFNNNSGAIVAYDNGKYDVDIAGDSNNFDIYILDNSRIDQIKIGDNNANIYEISCSKGSKYWSANKYCQK